MEDPVYLEDERVLQRMLASENQQIIKSYFETCTQDFTESDRHELAIWMRDVCMAEDCQPEVFPSSILIVDKFLSLVRTKRSQLQLLGSVALLVASKLRQTVQIPAKHLVYYTQDSITIDELKTWELFLLTTLKWDLPLISPVDFLDIFIRRMMLVEPRMISDIEDEAQRLVVECCLEFRSSLHPPSAIAWTCLLQSMKIWHSSTEHLRLTPKIQDYFANKIAS